jgi:hypothetical protein
VFSVRYGLSSYTVVLHIMFPRTAALRIESMHPQGHPVRLVRHGDTRQGTFCVMWINVVFKVLKHIKFVGFI